MAQLDWHAARSDLAGLAQLDRTPEDGTIDLVAVRRYRQDRVRAEMAKRGIDAIILSDPVNIRYATGTRNMQVFSMRNAPARYVVLTADRSILFEFTGCLHVAQDFETVDEVRPARTASFVAAGPMIAERERAWAAEMADLIAELTGKGARVGLERLRRTHPERYESLCLRARGLTYQQSGAARGRTRTNAHLMAQRGVETLRVELGRAGTDGRRGPGRRTA